MSSITNHTKAIPKVVLDRLSICATDPNSEEVAKSAGLLLSDKYTGEITGMKIRKNARYKVSAQIPLPYMSLGVQRHVVCIEIGNQLPGISPYRLDYNPSKLCEAGQTELKMLIDTLTHFTAEEFFATGKVTRMDVAIDLSGLVLNDVIVLSKRKQKHGVYSDKNGSPETCYLGTPRSARVVAYNKAIGGTSGLRIETRLKPGCVGADVAKLKNPFRAVELLPATVMCNVIEGVPGALISDHIRLRGLKSALKTFSKSDQHLIRERLALAASILPDAEQIWSYFPNALSNVGLAHELGVT